MLETPILIVIVLLAVSCAATHPSLNYHDSKRAGTSFCSRLSIERPAGSVTRELSRNDLAQLVGPGVRLSR